MKTIDEVLLIIGTIGVNFDLLMLITNGDGHRSFNEAIKLALKEYPELQERLDRDNEEAQAQG